MKIEDAKSNDDSHYFCTSITGKPTTVFEKFWLKDCKRTQETLNRKLEETSHHSRMQSSIREAISHRQTDCLDDLRLLQKIVATMKPSWDFE